VIERWLQITCDECGETDNSTMPNMTIAEFLAELKPAFIKRGKKHLCRSCYDPRPATGFTGCTCPPGRYDNNCIVHGGDEG